MINGSGEGEGVFSAYVEALAGVIGHADRERPLGDYCRGLLTNCERKSVEPLAAITAPDRTAAQHQSLLHFVGNGGWSDEKVLAKVTDLVLPALQRKGPIEAWIIDDTGFPKKGAHSVGVAHQYCGQRGKQENCQVAVSLSLANTSGSLPVAYRLYLPQAWAADAERRTKTHVPQAVEFKTKSEIALEQIRAAIASGLPRGVVLMDAGYGVNSAFRADVSGLGLLYVAGVLSSTSVWPPGVEPLPPKPYTPGLGRPTKRLRRDAEHQPVSVKDLAHSLPKKAWRAITWREGTNVKLKSRFARLRVRPAHLDYERSEPWPEEWLLIEWPAGEKEPAKYWLSTLPATIGFAAMVRMAKLRWRIERDYQELKQEVGLGHFEGRSWRGFHHHATLCIAAYGFLISQRLAIPPSGARYAVSRQATAVPRGSRSSRSAVTNRTSHPRLDRHDAPQPQRRDSSPPATMSVLRSPAQSKKPSPKFMTQ
jgi:SRSO17 transposase